MIFRNQLIIDLAISTAETKKVPSFGDNKEKSCNFAADSLPRRALRLVYEWLDLHRDELMENWERLSNSEAAKKIDPLN